MKTLTATLLCLLTLGATSASADSRLNEYDDSSLFSYLRSRSQGLKNPEANTCNTKYLAASSVEITKAIGKNLLATPLAFGTIMTFEKEVGRLLINPNSAISYGKLSVASVAGSGSVALGMSGVKNITQAREYHRISQILVAAKNITDCPEAHNGSMHPQASAADIESKIDYMDKCRSIEASANLMEAHASDLGVDIITAAEMINDANYSGVVCKKGLHKSVDSFIDSL